mgnify:CR=1 FL=1
MSDWFNMNILSAYLPGYALVLQFIINMLWLSMVSLFFYQKFMEIPKQGQEKVGQALAAYVYLMQPSSTTCIKCQKDYNFEDADGRDGRLYCPACGNKFV